jgi:hypothetical protein
MRPAIRSKQPDSKIGSPSKTVRVNKFNELGLPIRKYSAIPYSFGKKHGTHRRK